jgi:heme-degrading monooxygenase HmoA
MELDQYVWITTRRLKPGSREEFREAWRPSEFPDGMLRAYEFDAVGSDEVVGITVWDSAESRERYRLSEVEAERQRAMAPFVVETTSGFYTGRELKIPGR